MNNLKATLLGAVFLAGTLMSANAADVYSRGGSVKDSGPVDYRPAITWTGFYIGAHAGTTFDDTVAIDIDAKIEDDRGNSARGNLRGEADVDDTGIAGVHLGYNWQTAQNIVLGVEGNITIPFDSDEFGADYFASVRARLGFAFGNTLIYGTGGVAFLSWDEEILDDTTTGWVAGVGIEHKIRSNVSLGLEALYYSFEDELGSASGTACGGEGCVRANASADIERDFWTLQARLTYHLGGRDGAEPLK